MSKNSSSKHYQHDKERLQKEAHDMNVFLKKKKKKRQNVVLNDTKIYHQMKQKG